ncbi:hypothetical protein SLEP1_g3991 [Rubroshorea leprosula]|uniref:Uncharacterized protein n=1 Tax=Rubroshorea leprosula TaxID=152421 RepID=A0AAV5HTQ4_9ROSI|nr:hypothetical protein SLEP1_g3991 [Rubroshorea leprosula]
MVLALFSCSRTENGTQKFSPLLENPDLLLLPPPHRRLLLLCGGELLGFCLPPASSPLQLRFLQLENYGM